MKIFDKIKTVSSIIPSKTKEEETALPNGCDEVAQIEEQIEKEGESGMGKYLSRVDWIKVAAILAQNRYGKQFPLVVKLASSLAEQKPQNLTELMGAIKVFDMADLLSQVTFLKKKVPTPLLKLALGIIFFALKRCVKHHTED